MSEGFADGDGRAPPDRPRSQRADSVSAAWLMVGASLLFATMGVCVKMASAHYSAGEIVLYRGLTGAVLMGLLSRASGVGLRTRFPAAHFWRSLTGVCSLWLWFLALAALPIATAMTLNYMSSVWIALFLIGGTVLLGAARVEGRLVATVLVGFLGVALVLRPTLADNQLWHGLAGLLSGVLSALVYLQVAALGRLGEPEQRIVFYFSLGGIGAGALIAASTGWHSHTWLGAGLLLAVGVIATAAQWMMTRAYRIGGTLVNANLQYLGIAFAFLYGVVLFGEQVTWTALAGMALIVGAGVAATLLSSRVPAAKDAALGHPAAADS